MNVARDIAAVKGNRVIAVTTDHVIDRARVHIDKVVPILGKDVTGDARA